MRLRIAGAGCCGLDVAAEVERLLQEWEETFSVLFRCSSLQSRQGLLLRGAEAVSFAAGTGMALSNARNRVVGVNRPEDERVPTGPEAGRRRRRA